MNRIAIIATHHKGGTVWMSQTFRTIAKRLNIKFLPTLAFAALPEADRTPPLILNASNAREGLLPGLFDREDVRIFHLIRDPRDILISSMHYHRKAKENWLLRANPDLGGRTYQDALNACTSERERYDFEMQNATARNIATLLEWNYKRSNTFECRYEDLIRDSESELFLRIVEHLGFTQKNERARCGRIFWQHAIFGGKAEFKKEGNFAHVRSGEPEQWRDVFDRKLGEAFLTQFGDALVKLGYEKDDAWLKSLPMRRPRLDATSET